jgi:hypothetical protein
VLGWIATTLAQRTLPMAIVFTAFDAWDAIAGGLCALTTLIGLLHIIVHGLLYRRNDPRSSMRTGGRCGPLRSAGLGAHIQDLPQAMWRGTHIITEF